MCDSEFHIMVFFSVKTKMEWINYSMSEITSSILGFIVFESLF